MPAFSKRMRELLIGIFRLAYTGFKAEIIRSLKAIKLAQAALQETLDVILNTLSAMGGSEKAPEPDYEFDANTFPVKEEAKLADVEVILQDKNAYQRLVSKECVLTQCVTMPNAKNNFLKSRFESLLVVVEILQKKQ